MTPSPRMPFLAALLWFAGSLLIVLAGCGLLWAVAGVLVAGEVVR
jgi:hypothetical protein